ncbi:MAG: hypothetical protein EOR84_18765 [Mesorhizobium sp.]|uniref:hypothetical protein n=1 Tax=Mesorhizobium sp. TaxID=1871066 RepID=UPI000FE5BB65|nr:hypothetical protein [Mesorhizobium sp.]RWM92875.1 MAG: hypothetical protein EOR84_18765 [Mesorhizobium sp.]
MATSVCRSPAGGEHPTATEISDTLRRLETLRAELFSEGAHFRANTINRTIDLIKRLSPSKRDGH